MDFQNRINALQALQAQMSQIPSGERAADGRREPNFTGGQKVGMPAVSEFRVLHDHSGALGEAGKWISRLGRRTGGSAERFDYCMGVLRVSSEGLEYRTISSTDSRRDDFTCRFSDIREAQRNTMPLGGRYSGFHIKLRSGENYNFAHANGGRDLGPGPILEKIRSAEGQR